MERTDGVERRAKCSGRLPSGTPMCEPWLPEKARAGSWQLAQLVPGGSDRRSSAKIFLPSATSTGLSGGPGRGGMGRTLVRRAGTTGERGRFGILAAAHASAMVGLGAPGGAGLPLLHAPSANMSAATPRLAGRRQDPLPDTIAR